MTKTAHASQPPADLLGIVSRCANEAVMVTTADLDPPGPTIVSLNGAYTRMTGYEESDLLGKSPRLLQGPKTDRSVLDRLRADLEAGLDFVGRAINYRKDGSEFTLEWTISHIRDAEGRTTHFVSIQRDASIDCGIESSITSIKAELDKTKDELFKALKKLNHAQTLLVQQQRLAAIGDMAEGVAHDLMNMLAPITLAVDHLNHYGDLSEELRESVGVIDLASREARNLVANLRRFHRSCDKQDAPADTLVDLVEVVEDVSRLTQPRWMPDGGGTIEIQHAENAQVRGNPVQLRQAFSNLFVNATDAMPDGGKIRVTFEFGHNTITTEVSDSGCGMSEDVARRCLEPYFSTKGAGRGYGLSTCHGILARHSGELDVTSEIGVGTTFRVRLPRASQ